MPFENMSGNMYTLIRQGKSGYEESVFGIEHEPGKGAWVYNNRDENGFAPVMNLEELKELRDKLNGIIEYEQNYLEIKGRD